MTYVCCIAGKLGIHDTVINLTTKEQQNTIVIFSDHVKGYGHIMFFCFRFIFLSFAFYLSILLLLPEHRANMPNWPWKRHERISYLDRRIAYRLPLAIFAPGPTIRRRRPGKRRSWFPAHLREGGRRRSASEGGATGGGRTERRGAALAGELRRPGGGEAMTTRMKMIIMRLMGICYGNVDN